MRPWQIARILSLVLYATFEDKILNRHRNAKQYFYVDAAVAVVVNSWTNT